MFNSRFLLKKQPILLSLSSKLFLHFALSPTSSSNTWHSQMSFYTTSLHRFLCLISGRENCSAELPTYWGGLLLRCPYHRSLLTHHTSTSAFSFRQLGCYAYSFGLWSTFLLSIHKDWSYRLNLVSQVSSLPNILDMRQHTSIFIMCLHHYSWEFWPTLLTLDFGF